MTDTKFGRTLDRVSEKLILPILQLLTDDELDKENMIIRIVDFSFDKGVKDFISALDKEQMLNLLKELKQEINPEDSRKQLKQQIYQQIENLGLVELLMKLSKEHLLELANIIKYEPIRDSVEELADELNTEIINLGAIFVLNNLTDKELQNLADQLELDTEDLDKESIVEAIIYIKELSDEMDEELENETDEEKDDSEFSFWSCVYKRENGYKLFEEYLLSENLVDVLHCFIKISEFKKNNPLDLELAKSIYNTYFKEKSKHEIFIILDEFKEELAKKFEEKNISNSIFHDVECLLLPSLKDSHAKFLYQKSKKINKSMSLDFSQDLALLQFRKVASESHLNDVTPGSSPRGNESPPSEFLAQLKKPKYPNNQKFTKVGDFNINTPREFNEINPNQRKEENQRSPKTPGGSTRSPIFFEEQPRVNVDIAVIKEIPKEKEPKVDSTEKKEEESGKKLLKILGDEKLEPLPIQDANTPKLPFKINEATQKISRGPSLGPQVNKNVNISDYYLQDPFTLKGLDLSDNDHDYSDEKKSEIKSSTIDRLIDHATNYSQSDPGNENLFVFMLTYRTFISAEELLEKLKICFYSPPPKDLPEEKYAEFTSTDLTRTRLRVTKLIRYWLEHHFYDFDTELYNKLEAFVTEMRKTKGEYFASIVDTTIKKSKQKVVIDNRKSENTLNEKTLAPIIPKNKVDYSNFFAWSEKEIARQITFYEFELFKKIHPKEFLNKNFARENIKELAPNIDKFMDWFNKFSSWVSFKILEGKEPNDRVKNLSKFIKVANECKNLNNFNGAFEIMSATTITPIHRLTKTWALLSRRTKGIHDELSQFFTTKNNFKNLRTITQSASPPAIPYLGTYLRDLTYINDIQKNEMNGRINFNKRRQIGILIRELQKFSSLPYHIYPINILRQTLLTTTFHDDQELSKISFDKEKKESKKPGIITNVIPSFFTSNPDMNIFQNPIQQRDSKLNFSLKKMDTHSKIDLTSPLPSARDGNLSARDNLSARVDKEKHSSLNLTVVESNAKIEKQEKQEKQEPEKCLTPDVKVLEKNEKTLLDSKSSSDNELLKSKINLKQNDLIKNVTYSEDEDKISPIIGFIDPEVERLRKEVERLNNVVKENEQYKQRYEDLLHDHTDMSQYIDKLEAKITEYRENRQTFKTSLSETQQMIDNEVIRIEKIEKKLKKIQNFEERIEKIENILGIEPNEELDFIATIEYLEEKSKEFKKNSKDLNESFDLLGKKL